MSSSIELINPKAESVRRAAALQVCYPLFGIKRGILTHNGQVNTNGAMGLANVVKGNLGACSSRVILAIHTLTL